jgi:hypothetical protein
MIQSIGLGELSSGLRILCLGSRIQAMIFRMVDLRNRGLGIIIYSLRFMI